METSSAAPQPEVAERAQRSVRRRVGVAVAAVALVGAGAVTVMAVTGGSGGAAGSPEDAVLALVAAIEDEDVLGVLDVMDPAERDVLRHALESAQTEAERLELLDGAFSLDGIAGLDVRFDGLELETEDLEADLAVVHAVDGSVRATFDPETFPAGSTVRAVMDPGTGTESERFVFDDRGDGFLVTVQRDGHWYVSLSYTVAEHARRDSGLETLEPGTAATPTGFATAQEAAQALVDRVVGLDARGVVALAAPGEGDALARYAPLWLPDLDAALAGARADGLSLAVRDVTWDVVEDGDRARAEPTGYVLDGTVRAGTFSWGFDSTLYPPFDPTLPTVVNVFSDGSFVVIPAGAPVPDLIDDSTPRSDSEDLPFEANYAYANDEGAVVGQWSDESDAGPPAALDTFTVTYAAGCATVAGDVVDDIGDGQTFWFALWGEPEHTADGLRWCAATANAINWLFLPQVLAALQPPSVALVRQGGLWYVSPLGTLTGIVTDELRSIGTGTPLLDSALTFFLLGETRTSLEAALRGSSRGDHGEACDAISEFDADGMFLRVVADPAADLVRRCSEAYWSDDGGYEDGWVDGYTDDEGFDDEGFDGYTDDEDGDRYTDDEGFDDEDGGASTTAAPQTTTWRTVPAPTTVVAPTTGD